MTHQSQYDKNLQIKIKYINYLNYPKQINTFRENNSFFSFKRIIYLKNIIVILQTILFEHSQIMNYISFNLIDTRNHKSYKL